jgi:hypothetical protein
MFPAGIHQHSSTSGGSYDSNRRAYRETNLRTGTEATVAAVNGHAIAGGSSRHSTAPGCRPQSKSDQRVPIGIPMPGSV